MSKKSLLHQAGSYVIEQTTLVHDTLSPLAILPCEGLKRTISLEFNQAPTHRAYGRILFCLVIWAKRP